MPNEKQQVQLIMHESGTCGLKNDTLVLIGWEIEDRYITRLIFKGVTDDKDSFRDGDIIYVQNSSISQETSLYFWKIIGNSNSRDGKGIVEIYPHVHIDDNPLPKIGDKFHIMGNHVRKVLF
jgi:hypothetical protein